MQDDEMKRLRWRHEIAFALAIYNLFSEQNEGRVLTFGHLKPSLCIVLLLSSLANLVALTVLASRLRIA